MNIVITLSQEGNPMQFKFPKAVLVIHTNKYAGNFEREMTAYSTGNIGECEVGMDLAELFNVENEGREIEMFHYNDDGCSRPTSIWPSPEGGYDSVGMFFHAAPDDELIAFIIERVKEFCFKEGIQYISHDLEEYEILKKITVY